MATYPQQFIDALEFLTEGVFRMFLADTAHG